MILRGFVGILVYLDDNGGYNQVKLFFNVTGREEALKIFQHQRNLLVPKDMRIYHEELKEAELRVKQETVINTTWCRTV